MVGVLDRKLWRDLKTHRGLLVAITSIMAVGVACYVANSSSYRNLSLGQRDYYAECRMADFSIELKKVPLADLAAVGQIPGVVEIRPRIHSYATVDVPGVSEPLNGLVLSLPDRREPVINDVLLRRGGYFTDARANEVLVSDAFARRHKLYPGQRLHLLLNNRRQELVVVGTAISSEFTYLVGPGTIAPDPERFGVFYLKRSFAEEVFDFQGAASQVLGRLAPNWRDRPDDILRQSEALLEPFGVFTTTPLRDQPSNRFLSNEIQQLGTFGMVLPTIFLVVAALVLNMLMSRLIEQQRVVVGTLKALGYSNLQVFRHYLRFGLAVGALGGLAGCVVGYTLAELITSVYRVFFQFPSLVNRFYLDTYAGAILLSLACGLVGSLHGAAIVLRLEPAEAMRPKPPARGGRIWLENWTWFWSQLSFGWRMTLRNVFRQRLRTAAGMVAAMMGACVAILALSMSAAVNYLIDFQFHQIQRYDIEVAFKDEHGLDVLAQIRALPGVDRVEPVFDLGCTFRHGRYERKGGITGLVPDHRLTLPRDTSGRLVPIPESGLVMTRKLAEVLHLSPGDEVEIIPFKGDRLPRRAHVARISDSYLGLAVYADQRFLAQLVGEEFACSGVQLQVNPEAGSMAQLYAELKRMPAVQAVVTRRATIQNLTDTLIRNQQIFILILICFAGLLFFGSVLNMSLINLAERQREVATLRVLGYGPWQIGGLFLRESAIVNVLGTLVGLPCGYLLSSAIVTASDTEWFRIPNVHPRETFPTTFVLGLLFAVLAQGVVQWAVFRMDWLEAMKTKE